MRQSRADVPRRPTVAPINHHAWHARRRAAVEPATLMTLLVGHLIRSFQNQEN